MPDIVCSLPLFSFTIAMNICSISGEEMSDYLGQIPSYMFLIWRSIVASNIIKFRPLHLPETASDSGKSCPSTNMF